MKTKANLSTRQEALKTRHKLSNRQFQQMLEMLAGLTPAERASLKDPDFITEDEADIIWINREPDGPNVSSVTHHADAARERLEGRTKQTRPERPPPVGPWTPPSSTRSDRRVERRPGAPARF
jgi:hypothetical protein